VNVRPNGPSTGAETIVAPAAARASWMSCASGARLRDPVQVGARDDVADGERDRRGGEHDGVRRSRGGALEPQVPLVESGGTLQVAYLQ
jgi:hypothetical protein